MKLITTHFKTRVLNFKQIQNKTKKNIFEKINFNSQYGVLGFALPNSLLGTTLPSNPIVSNNSMLAEGECASSTVPRSSFVETHWFWRTSPPFFNRWRQPISLNLLETRFEDLRETTNRISIEISSYTFP